MVALLPGAASAPLLLTRLLLAPPRHHRHSTARSSARAILRTRSAPRAPFSPPRRTFFLRSSWRKASLASSPATRSHATSFPSDAAAAPAAASAPYDADQIQVLEGLNPVRKRPGMYIGGTGSRGLHHLSLWRKASLVSPATRLHAKSFTSDAATPEAASAPYDADQIQVLEGLDPVRKRPGMYIGCTGSKGLHHLVYEVLDNAIDEAQGGFSTEINVVLFPDGSVSITDNGRGIPTDIHPVTKKSALETVLTVLHAGGKFGGDRSGYTVSGGLHGVGVSVVNALSERLEVTVWRGGKEYFQAYERGKAACEITCKEFSDSERSRTGTCVRFWPDKEVFLSTTKFDYNIIAGRARELAFLNPELSIKLTQEDENPEMAHTSEYHFSGGLIEYTQWLNSDKKGLHEPISFKSNKENLSVEVVLLWCEDSFVETLLGYANSIRMNDGGTHLDGAKAAITRTFNILGRKVKLIKEKDDYLSGEHVREGLTCIVSVKLQDPEFEGQTKTRLGNPEVRKLVDQIVYEFVTEFFELHPGIFEAVLSKAIQAAKAASAAKRSRDLVRQKGIVKSSTLPGKLSDCSCRDPKEAEIFIVEGDSAGGTAKQARDRHYQAILPIRGKILNIERSDEESIYKNEEIQKLIIALGLGLKGEVLNRDQLRYHKVIILTDADVDGSHIRTLLLTFFFRYQRSLFEEGFIYIAVPPLYKLEKLKKIRYCYDDNELQDALRNFQQGHTIQRFKGLGEMMPAQLWDTTMDPSRRLLKQVTVDDAVEANLTLSILLGKKVEARRELIQNSPVLLNLETAAI